MSFAKLQVAQYIYRDVLIHIQRIKSAHYRSTSTSEDGKLGDVGIGNDVTADFCLQSATRRIDSYYTHKED